MKAKHALVEELWYDWLKSMESELLFVVAVAAGVLEVELLLDGWDWEFGDFVPVVVDVLDYLDQSGELLSEPFQSQLFLQDLGLLGSAVRSQAL